MDTNSSKSDQTSFSKPKVSSGSGACFNDVLIQIRELCSKDLAEEAINVAKTYLAISSSDVNFCILRVLLISVFYFNVNAVKDNNLNFKIFDDIVSIIRNFKVCNKQLASFFIVRCCSHPDLNPYSKQLFHYCRESNIPLSSKAVNAFCEIEKSKEVPLPDLLRYLHFIQLVCRKKVPKDLLNLALEKCDTSMFADVHHICELLHGISIGEVEESCLVKFIQLCFKESMWQYVAEMFIIWGSKNRLSHTIHLALAADPETVGKYFRKFANYVHGKEGSLSSELTDKFNLEQKCAFGQIGIALMLKSFSRGDLENALEILYTLHTYNVNYYKLELALENSDLNDCDSDADNFSSKIFPFYVVFVAVDICLQLNRPKDALTIFQDCSWVTVDSVEVDLLSYIGKERCERLLKLVPLLNNQDYLDEGWDALEKLLTAIKQDSSPEFVKENAESLGRIYEEYMISLLNSDKISLAYILYQYSLGPRKDLFTVSSDVLRGLIVAFAKDGRYAAVKSLLLIGIMKKIYPVQKPNLETFPWEISLMTNWTAVEIEVVVEWYTEILFPLLKNKTNETFEEWFSIKIAFIITPQNSSRVECLNETVTDPKYYISKTKNALLSMNPPLEVTEITKEKALCITSNSLYNFWKNRCPDVASFDLQFVKFQNKFSFGIGEKGSGERDSSIFVQEFFSPTITTPNSSEEHRYQSIDQPSQYYSPRSPATSPESLYSMINEAKANSSKSTQLATTTERTPPTQNLKNSVSPRSNGLISNYNAAFYGNENSSELHQQGFYPHYFQSQSDSPNVFCRRNNSPRQSGESQHLAGANTNQSYHENTGVSYSSSDSVRNFSLPLLPTPLFPPNVPQSAIPKNCLNINNSFTENNFTKRVDSSVRQKSPAAMDRSLVNYHNSTVNRRSIEGLSTSHPSVRNANLNNQPIIPKLNNQVMKESSISTPSKLGLNKLKRSSVLPTQTPKNKKKLITFNKTPMKHHTTVLKGKISKAVKTLSSKMVEELSKKDLTSQFTLKNETVSNSADASTLKTDSSVINSQSKTPLNAQFAKPGPSSISNALNCSSPANKMKKKIVKKGKKFQNFTVCITPEARTVNTSSNQSLSALKQGVPNNNDINERNTEEKPDAEIPNLPAGSKTIQSSCEKNKININRNLENPNVSFKNPTKQSFTSVTRTIQNECKINAASLSNVKISPSKSYSTSTVSNSLMSQHPPVSKQSYKINLVNNSNEDKTSLLASASNSKSVSPKLLSFNQQRQPVNELNKPHTAGINASPKQSGNSVPKNKITLTRTVNLNRVTNTDKKNVIVDKHSPKNKVPQTQTSKPVIKRDFRSTLNNYLDSWQDEHGSVPTVPSIVPSERQGDPKFELKKIHAESSQSSRPFSGHASCGEEVFTKIRKFLTSRLALKNKSTSTEEHKARASSLADAFIQNNGITKLDKTTMKLLKEFADKNV